MSFTPVTNVRINSLTPGAVAQLRFGKAAVKSKKDDFIAVAELVEHRKDGDKSVAVFKETDVDGNSSETVISRFPGAPWRSEVKDPSKSKQPLYVSLVGVDESTFTIIKAASPISTDAIEEAIKLIEAEREDVYAAEHLIALLTQIKDGTRINVETKALANRFAAKIVSELSAMAENTPAQA